MGGFPNSARVPAPREQDGGARAARPPTGNGTTGETTSRSVPVARRGICFPVPDSGSGDAQALRDRGAALAASGTGAIVAQRHIPGDDRVDALCCRAGEDRWCRRPLHRFGHSPSNIPRLVRALPVTFGLRSPCRLPFRSRLQSAGLRRSALCSILGRGADAIRSSGPGRSLSA